MSLASAFQASGPTVLLAVSAASQQIAIAQTGTIKTPSTLRVYNSSANVVYIAFGAAAPGPTAAIPVGGTPALGLPVAPGAVEVFTVPGGDGGGTYIAAMAAVAGPSNVFLTPGEGL